MKALKHRTSLDAYDPFRGKLIWPGEDTRGVPLLINRYVDHHIEKFWEESNSALSRNVLKLRVDQLAKEINYPFRIATFEPISRQRGRYGWQAPWMTAIAIYQVLRKLRPRKNDSISIDMALLAFQASVGKIVDQSRFHLKKRQVLKQFPKIDENLEEAYGIFLRERAPATALLEPPLTPLDFAIMSFK
jgi:hypothetical protein